MNIKEIQSLRRVFLLKLYETTGGDRWKSPTMFEIGNSIGIDSQLTIKIVDYLSQKGSIKIQSKARDICITTDGIDEAESYFDNENTNLTPDEINNKLDEINNKLDLLSLGHKIIYEDIMEQLNNSQSIQKKDLKLILFSAIFSKGLDAIKIGQILEIIK
jgi:hypothetical protein